MSDSETPVELIILGMHRSGTSSVAGFFQQSGWFFGPDEQSFDLHTTNRKGFFERRDVVCLNDRLLDSYGASWITPDRFPGIPGSPVDFRRHPERAIADSILDAMRRVGPFFIKDPRMCVTLPFWLPLFRRPFFLLVVRHPLNVARSLASRRDCGLAAGLALWERYSRDMLRFTEGLPRAVVHFEQIMADPAGRMGGILQTINRTTGGPLPDHSTDLASRWFESDLVHHRVDDEALSDHAPESLVRFYRDLVADGANAASRHEPVSTGSRHALAELANEVIQRQQAPCHAAMWHARHSAMAREQWTTGLRQRRELEALLQSWRWKLPDRLAGLAGMAPNRARHGFDTDLLRRDADAANERVNQEAHLLATARRTFPLIHLPHENLPPGENRPMSILLVSAAELPGLAASWLIAFTGLIATRGHRVDWLTRHDMARIIDDTDLPVFAHAWKNHHGEAFGMDVFESLLAQYDLVILDGNYDQVWHPPLGEALQRSHRHDPVRGLALGLPPDAAPCRLAIPTQAEPRFDLTILAIAGSDARGIATALATAAPGSRYRTAVLHLDGPVAPEWQVCAEQTGWVLFDCEGSWSANLALLGDSQRFLVIRPVDLAWPIATGRPGYLWSDETASTLATLLSGVHDTSAMRYDQHVSRIVALRQAEQRVLEAIATISTRSPS